MSDYEWIPELKDRVTTEQFVERAADKLGNREVVKQIVDAARKQERKKVRLELRAEIEAEVRKEIETKLTRKIEARLTREIEAKFRKRLRREVEADFKSQLRDLVDFGRWFSWKTLRFKRSRLANEHK